MRKQTYSSLQLQYISYQIKKIVVSMLHFAKSGHSAGAIGLSEIFAVLYGNVLNISPNNYNLNSRDYLILSNGHTCPVLYATLAYFKFFDMEELETLRRLNSRMQGHPHFTNSQGTLPGVENSGGPLGQGISQAVGIAAVLKRDMKKNKVFCIVGDGECEEGQVWEALLFAKKEALDNLIVIVDKNNIQIDGTPQEVLGFDNLVKKFQSFGCSTTQCEGNSIEQLSLAITHALEIKHKPHVIVANTTGGSGISFMENKVSWHGKVPNNQELNQAILEIDSKIEQLRNREYN